MNKRKLHIFSSIFLLILFNLSLTASAQVYNNEWVVPGQTYYKFKIPADGLYRLTTASLTGQAILSSPVSNFQLWRNGVQVPIYGSTAGVLGSADYIEFWGEHNDGQVDASLFQKPEDQVNKARSFEGDSSSYFLTVNMNPSQNLRFNPGKNEASTKAGTMTALPYFMYTTQQDLGTVFNRGPATAFGSDYVYQSDYRGKSFGRIVKGAASTTVSFTGLNAYTGAVNAQIAAGMSGASTLGLNRKITVSGGDGSTVSGNLANFASQVFVIGDAKVSSTFKVTVSNGATNASDQLNVSFVSLTYPRTFNFTGLGSLGFDLPASSDSRLLDITGFAGGTPVLYDETSHVRYEAYVSGAHYQFVLPSMPTSHLALVGQGSTSYTTITGAAISPRNYPDLKNSNNQGNYLIISNKALYGSGNYVQQYASYRSSAVGGSYKTQVYNIDDLEDMFAFGVKSSPVSIRNFLRYARSQFTTQPKFVFLIGRGLSFDNLQGVNAADPEHEQQSLLPTYSWPASDVMLASNDFQPVAATPIGRLSAVKPEEVKNYLDKVTIYEASQQNDDNTVESNSWKKRSVFVSGGGNAGEESLFSSYLNTYRSLLKDSLYGANSYYLSKSSSSEVSSSDADALKNYFAAGIGLISYFGHGASTTLGYGELNDPSVFTNNGRFPIMFTSGCDVGDCFAFMPGRASSINNITERYLFTKDKGSVAFIAQSYLGVTSFLHSYDQVMYKNLATTKYGQPITHSMQASQLSMITPGNIGGDTITAYAHAEQTNFLGDPAISLFNFSKPDFVVQQSDVYTPTSLSITDTKFHIKAYMYNIGRAVGDSVHIAVNRKLPDGTTEVILEKNITSIRYMDSLDIDVAIDPNKDAGSNIITVSIDDDNKYPELSESNNSASKTIFIYANGITPVYPYNYSIIRSPNTPLTASTSDALAASTKYVMELDTTELFNSASKIIKNVTSIGGAISFDPGLSYKDSAVYYWRVSSVPLSGADYRWAKSSFQYIAVSGSDKLEGAGQSHYDQHKASVIARIGLDSVSRKWVFNNLTYSINVPHAVLSSGVGYSNFGLKVNNVGLSNYYCVTMGNSIMFNILTSDGLKPYFNQSNPDLRQSGTNSSIGGFMGSTAACMLTPYSYDRDPVGFPNVNKYNFQFKYQTTADRNNIAAFMKWVPNNSYVVVRLFIAAPYNKVPLVGDWKSDGSGETTLYQQFLDAGLSSIESFTTPGIGVFIYKKGDHSFTPIQELTGNTNSQIQLLRTLTGKDSLGYITSPKFGPAKEWKSVQWNGNSEDKVNTDNATLDVMGVTANGTEKYIKTLKPMDKPMDISDIDAAQYPYVQLKMRNADSINYTPYQLRYWHVLYTPVPEGALAGNIKLINKDTIDLAQDLNFAIAFKNISDQPFTDSIKATLSIKDRSNALYTIPISKLKRIEPGDTAMVDFTIPGDTSIYNSNVPVSKRMPIGTINLGGQNTLSLDINPNLDQPEQLHDNNFLYTPFFVRTEQHNPLLDVTFDGIHILDNDIVAAKPIVSIKLNDDSKYLLLNDTSIAQISLRYPDGTIRNFGYNSDTLSFKPAKDSSNNEALIDFRPYLTQDGAYELMVKGQGKTGAVSTATNYSVNFQVYNKPMISDMFNYPNPFTSSTAFVFTITGSQVPQNIRIQILTITGKIVKEITKAELGALHIGRNITDYKWDGTDNFGQKLANGVYLYRVITNQDGKRLDHFTIRDGDDNEINTSKYFNKGYGKMYLMR